MIGGVEFVAGGGALRLVPLVLRSGEEGHETGPIFLLCCEAFPDFAVIDEETGLINELECNADYLLEAVRSVAGGDVVTTIFDLVKKGFDRLVNIVKGAKDSLILLKIRGGDVGVGGVQVIQYGAGGDEAVSDVLVLEGADENFVNSREKNCSESLVGAIVIIEECGGGVKSIAELGDLGASGVVRDDGFIAGVDMHDEGDGRQGVVVGG